MEYLDMKFPTRYFVAAALVAAPVAAQAQTAPPAAEQGQHAREGRRGELRGQRGPGGSPVARLLAQRQRLSLTDAQVQRLQAIDRGLQARNAPLQQQLAALFPERADRPQGDRAQRGDRARGERRAERPQLTEAQRQQMQQRRAQAEPIMQQLRQNGDSALAQARTVLTAQQQAQVQQMLERRGDRGERDGRGERGRRGGERQRGRTGESR
jgi:Spy/CpxP family protein refolding chaperone